MLGIYNIVDDVYMVTYINRKLLVADYNELKLQQTEEGDGNDGVDMTGGDDPTVLKLKLT